MNRRQFLTRGAMAAVAVSVAPAAVFAVTHTIASVEDDGTITHRDGYGEGPHEGFITVQEVEDFEENDYWEVWSKKPNCLSMTRVYCDETGSATLPTYLWAASSQDELNYRYVSREEASEQKRIFYEIHWPILKGRIRYDA